MSPRQTIPLSRRSLLALGATLALPFGCVATLPGIHQVNLDAIADDQALLLGRIRLSILDLDHTGDAFIRINTDADEVLLPAEGEVAWVVRRPGRWDVRLAQITSSHKRVILPRGPVLAPYAVRTAINYFGTIRVTLDRRANESRDSGRTGHLEVEVVDQQGTAMAAFVAQNPRLAGRIYYHVLRGEVLQAPSLRA